MAKRRRTQPAATGKTHGVINGAGEVVEQNIDSTIRENYMPYAMSVILSRAIPEIDGFKPSHRKLLYTMYKMGLLNGARTKSANIVGATMKLNPHGDSAIYDTMVRLSRGYEALLHPYVDSKGNFGKFYSRDMAWAASRYTEAKLDKICNELFRDIDKDTVDFVDNYDNTMKEPSLLPVAFPSVLVNTNTGIAVGMASNICSFNLKEICETTAALIRDPNHDVMQTLPAPDFIGGCQIIYDENALRQVYETGKGGIKLRARYQYDKSANCIDVLSIPSTTTCEVIIEKIIDLVKAGKIKDIADVRDETGIDGLKITIDLKRGADPDKLMAKLYRFTTLEDSFSCNFNVLIGGVPRVLGVKALLEEWIAFRIECVRRRTYFDRNKKAEKLHLLKGLEAILLDIDKAIAIIRHTEKDTDVVPNLMEGFDIDEVQAEYIAEIKLRSLNKEYIINRTAEIEKLMEELEELNRILGDDNEVKNIIADQLKKIAKKYGQERKTTLISGEEITEYNETENIDDYPLTIFVTRDNYIKKISAVSLRSSTTEHKLKETDEIVQTMESTNKSELIFFSNKCVAYKMKTYDLADAKVSTMGEYLPGILGLEEDEKIVYTVVTTDYKGEMLFTFENGKMAKVALSNYETKTNRKKLIGAYGNKSPICDIRLLDEDKDVVLMSDNNRVLLVNTEKIPLKATKSTQGIQVITLRKKDAKVVKVVDKEQCTVEDIEHYRPKNIPAAGGILRGEDNQISLI